MQPTPTPEARAEQLGGNLYSNMVECPDCEGKGGDEWTGFGGDSWSFGSSTCEACDGSGEVAAICDCCHTYAPIMVGGESCAPCHGAVLIEKVARGLWVGVEAQQVAA